MKRWCAGVLAVAAALASVVAARDMDELQYWPPAETTPAADAYNAAMGAHTRATVDALVVDGTPESLRLVAVMVAGRSQPVVGCNGACPFEDLDTPHILGRALAANPEDALLLWAASLEQGLDEAERDRIVTRLQQVDADNAAVWMLSLSGDDDDESLDEMLAAAAMAPRHHQYFNDRLRAYDKAFQALDLPPVLWDIPDEFGFASGEHNARMLLVLGLALSDAIPGYQAVTRLCRESDGDRRDHCLRLARTMAFEADTLLAAFIGLAILRTLDPNDALGWRARDRELEWWSIQAGTLGLDPERYGSWYMEESRKPGATEISVLRELARRRGVPLQPPVQWESQRELSRRLYGN